MMVMNPEIAEQFELTRQQGLYNMFDFNGVQRVAFDNDYYELVTWMEDHQQHWGRLIFEGFMVELPGVGIVSAEEFFKNNPVEEIEE